MSADNSYGYPHSIDICLLGPTQVGKTSLLATMYHTMNHNLPKSFSFEPLEYDVLRTLTNAYIGLEKIAKTAPQHIIRQNIEGTQTIQEYAFGLDFIDKNTRQKEKLAKVTFYDPPGKYLDNLTEENFNTRIMHSPIIINVIDAGVMMMATGTNAERFNCYSSVHHLLNKALENDNRLGRNRAVLFVLTKAETWIHDNPDEMRQRFVEHHGKAINLFHPTLNSNRVAAYLPVETLGNCRFSQCRETEDGEEIIQYKRNGTKPFEPRLVYMPLLYALKFTLAEVDRRKGMFDKLWDWMFGNYTELIEAMGKFDPGTDAAKHIAFYGNKNLFDA